MDGSDASAPTAAQPEIGSADEAGRAASRLSRWAVAAPFAAVLLGLIGQLTFGRAIIWTGDSFGFVYPGLLMAAGADAAGQLNGRNVGYPWLTSLVLPLGGLRALVTVQSIFAAAGLSALLLVLRTCIRNPFAFCGAGLLLALTVYASDSFVVYAQTINGDSLFGSLLAISLWLFLSGWRAAGSRRMGFLAGALGAAYAAYLVKPNSILTVVLCLAALVICAIRAPRSLLGRRVVAGLVALAVGVFAVQAWQARLAQKDADFGPRVLFCGHLDAVAFDLGEATPERRALKQALDRVRTDPRKWSALGYDADLCYYGQEAHDAIHAAAKSEGLDDGAWMTRRFALSTLRHPKAYVSGALHQIGFFLAHPNLEADLVYPSQMTDWDWTRLAPYERLIRAPRAELDRPIGSWMAQRHVLMAHLGKHLAGLVIRTLSLVALVSLLLAAVRLWRRRSVSGPVELAFLAASTFLAASVLSVALSFTFDIPRYAASFAPLTYLWWFIALAYLASVGREALATRGSPVSAHMSLASDGLVLTARWPDIGPLARGAERALGVTEAFASRVSQAVVTQWRVHETWVARVAQLVPMLLVLLYLWMQLRLGFPLLYTADSFGYVYPGMVIAAGDDVTGELGGRNIGFPLFSALVLPWRGFPGLVTAQAVVASLGLAGLVLVLRRMVRPAAAFAVVGGLLVLTVVASDSFVLNAQNLNGETMYGAALALALALFVMALTRRGSPRAGYLLGALAASYVTWLFKPNALLTIPLCGAALVAVAILDWRAILKPSLLIGLAAFIAFAGATYAYQSKAQPKDYDFGTRVLYCGHIDLVLPELGTATPQRRRLAQVLDAVRHSPPQGWITLGYDADGCFYGADAFAAIHAAAAAEGLSDKGWMGRQFQHSALHRPQVYAGEIWRQVVQYFRYPDGEADVTVSSSMSDVDWQRLTKYPRLIGMPRSAFKAEGRSWFATDHTLPRIGKRLIALASKSLAWVTGAATLLALLSLPGVWRRRTDATCELAALASSAFMLAVILTTAISYTFDVGRYASSFAPAAFAWWMVSVWYLAIGVWRFASRLRRALRRRAQPASNVAASAPFTR
jgi:hypothetical protein